MIVAESLDFVGPFEETSWKLARAIVPIACVFGLAHSRRSGTRHRIRACALTRLSSVAKRLFVRKASAEPAATTKVAQRSHGNTTRDHLRWPATGGIPRHYAETRIDQPPPHGKEGVDGSSPSEGSSEGLPSQRLLRSPPLQISSARWFGAVLELPGRVLRVHETLARAGGSGSTPALG